MVHRLLEMTLRDRESSKSFGDKEENWKPLTAIADQCNSMRIAAKRAQERSDRVFLAVFLQNTPTFADAVVIGVGDKSFSVLVTCLGEEFRLFIDEMENMTCHFDKEKHLLVLKKAATPSQSNRAKITLPNTLEFSEMTVTILSKVVVYLSATPTPPLDVRCSLVCLGTCDDTEYQPRNLMINK